MSPPGTRVIRHPPPRAGVWIGWRSQSRRADRRGLRLHSARISSGSAARPFSTPPAGKTVKVPLILKVSIRTSCRCRKRQADAAGARVD